jgi:integrase
VRSANRKSFPPNLYQDKNGYFSYRNPISGKRRGVGKDKATAFREARAANAVLANMEPSTLSQWITGVVQVPLTEWVDTYHKKWLMTPNLAANTIKGIRLYTARIKAAEFAWRPISTITTLQISTFLNGVIEAGGVSTAPKIRALLTEIFRSAEANGLIENGKNPVAPIVDEKKPSVKRERLSWEQFLLIRDDPRTETHLRNAMNLALVTGQRREDISLAKFADCRDGYLFIVQGKSQGRTKLQLDATIRLGVLGMSIEEVVKSCRGRIVSPFIIHRTKNYGTRKVGSPLKGSKLNEDLAHARDRVGIVAAEGRSPPTFHEIRSLSERLYKKEYGAEFAQALLGHKNAKTTEVYDDLRVPTWKIVAMK